MTYNVFGGTLNPAQLTAVQKLRKLNNFFFQSFDRKCTATCYWAQYTPGFIDVFQCITLCPKKSCHIFIF